MNVTWSFGLCLKMLKYVPFHTICYMGVGLRLKALEYVLYQTIPYAMKSYLKGHVRLHHQSSK